jgi:hypothetical protein
LASRGRETAPAFEKRPMRDDPPQALQSCHDLLLWLIPLLDQFPRSRRFTLGER